jgi:hypothetical protein
MKLARKLVGQVVNLRPIAHRPAERSSAMAGGSAGPTRELLP